MCFSKALNFPLMPTENKASNLSSSPALSKKSLLPKRALNLGDDVCGEIFSYLSAVFFK
jgi:hypothetical protein